MKTSLKIVVAIAVTLILGSRATAYEGTQDTRVVDEQRLPAAVAAVRRAILSEDVRAPLQNISQVEPLGCTDSAYSLEKVKAFLRDKNSHLYTSLFDSLAFAKRCGREYPPEYPAISEKEFLRSARDAVQVTRLDRAWVEVTLTSPVPTHYAREWFFHWESGEWKLAGGSLVIGNCSCG